MEAALLFINLCVMLLLVFWSARVDSPGKQLSGRGPFDMTQGADCDHRRQKNLGYQPPDQTGEF